MCIDTNNTHYHICEAMKKCVVPDEVSAQLKLFWKASRMKNEEFPTQISIKEELYMGYVF